MTNDLKPCPFCGGEAHAALAAYASGATAHVVCDGCGAKVYGYSRSERGLRDAVESWNRRAERTCRVVSAKECGGVGYAPGCSECGWQMAGSMWHNFCPNCGSMVIREETDNAD